MNQSASKPHKRLPVYVWAIVLLVAGLTFGGQFPDAAAPLVSGTEFTLKQIVVPVFIPVLIVLALCPSITTMIEKGTSGRFAASVVSWYVLTSTLAGLIGCLSAFLVFRVPIASEDKGAVAEATRLVLEMFTQLGAAAPLIAIAVSIAIAVAAVFVPALKKLTAGLQNAFELVNPVLQKLILPFIFCLGVVAGVKLGTRVGLQSYFALCIYTGVLCLGWTCLYLFGVLFGLGKIRPWSVFKDYYLPTAAFAAGTCSSLLTLPVNLENARVTGVKPEVANFVVPFGAVANMDASALMYTAYAPFVLSFVCGHGISLTMMLISWPAIVLFTLAAPGLPAGMGTALWTSTLYTSMLKLPAEEAQSVIAIWVALAGGIPDMIRTATNCTGDGFTAILFDRWFGSPIQK